MLQDNKLESPHLSTQCISTSDEDLNRTKRRAKQGVKCYMKNGEVIKNL